MRSASRKAPDDQAARIFSVVTITPSRDENLEPDIAGYKIYAGRQAGVYDAVGRRRVSAMSVRGS